MKENSKNAAGLKLIINPSYSDLKQDPTNLNINKYEPKFLRVLSEYKSPSGDYSEREVIPHFTALRSFRNYMKAEIELIKRRSFTETHRKIQLSRLGYLEKIYLPEFGWK